MVAPHAASTLCFDAPGVYRVRLGPRPYSGGFVYVEGMVDRASLGQSLGGNLDRAALDVARRVEPAGGVAVEVAVGEAPQPGD